MRKRRVPNPEYKAIAVGWKFKEALAAQPTSGKLELEFSAKKGSLANATITLPCDVYKGMCMPRKYGTVKGTDSKGKKIENQFSLIPDEGAVMNRFAIVLNDIIEQIGKTITKILKAKQKNETSISGESIIPPKKLRIPKMVTVQEVSLEWMQEEGLMP